jgi:hypothetical protein
MATNKISYRIIAFGTNEHGFFNQFAYSSTIGYALGLYNGYIADCEMDGAVLVEVEHETWKVIEQFGTEGVNVVEGLVGNIKVVQVPELAVI